MNRQTPFPIVLTAQGIMTLDPDHKRTTCHYSISLADLRPGNELTKAPLLILKGPQLPSCPQSTHKLPLSTHSGTCTCRKLPLVMEYYIRYQEITHLTPHQEYCQSDQQWTIGTNTYKQYMLLLHCN